VVSISGVVLTWPRVPPVPRIWGPGKTFRRVISLCMKRARIRYQQTGEFHFLTFSCYRRRANFSEVATTDLFEDALERVRVRYLFVVAG
jgi:hypothetical protein